MNTPLRRLGIVIALLFASLLTSTTWVQFIDAGSLNDQTANARSRYKQLGRERGPILVNNTPVAESTPVDDEYRYQRTYPGGAVYAPVTGSFSIIFGETGMEAASDDLLSGESGQLFYRRIGDLLTGQEPQGASVELTIDPKVQQAAYKALGSRRGAVVALDPATGDILAMVSRPSYDPNALAGHVDAKVRSARTALLDDEDEPLKNRAISELYPPGSVFKLITSAAALSTGKYTPTTTFPGPAELDLPLTTKNLPNDDGRICGNGTPTLTYALQESCNTVFGGLGLTLGAAALNEQAAKFGFGQSLTTPLRVVPSRFPAGANAPQTAQSAIGQFDVQVTPLQIAMVAAAIANGGVVMRPNLVKEVRGADLDVIEKHTPERLSEAVSSDVAAQLTTMMEAVVKSGTGTRAQISGVTVAGKTGTAQHGEGTSPHAWFTAFAPAEAPKVAVAVIVEDGGGQGDAASGGRLAAPVAKQVIEAVLDQ